jgi:hypothetical protein
LESGFVKTEDLNWVFSVVANPVAARLEWRLRGILSSFERGGSGQAGSWRTLILEDLIITDEPLEAET